MKRPPFFDWIGRHKIATLVPATIAALVVVAWLVHGHAGSPERLATAVAALRSAETCLERSQLDDADRHCERAIEILGGLARNSGNSQVRFEQAAALETMALIQSASGRPDQADVFYRKAFPLWARVLGDNPSDSTVRWRLARCLARRASLLSDAGRWLEAENALERADLVCRTRVKGAVADERVDRERVLIKNQLGLLFLHTDRPALALENFEGAVAAENELIRTSSTAAADQELLISLLCNQASTYSATKQRAAALGKLGEARALAERLTAENPSIGRLKDLLATIFEREAAATGALAGNVAQAREWLVRACAIRRSLVAGAPEQPDYVEKLAASCGALAENHLATGSNARAEEFEREELVLRSKLHQEHPGVVAYRSGLGRALHNLAELLRQSGRAAEALSLSRQAAPLLAAVHRENLLDETHRRAASNAYWSLCTLELDQKDHRAAAEAVAALQAIEPRGFEEAHESAGFLCRCVALCRDDHGSPPAEMDKLARSYADRAIAALETAVRYGFRDLNELLNSRVYDPLRSHPDFARVMQRVAAIDEALKQG